MRFSGFLLVLPAILSFTPNPAMAIKDTGTSHRTWVNKLWDGYWGDKIWEGYDFEPYLGDETIKNRTLWDRDGWSPQAWIDDAGDPRRIMHDLYARQILIDQYRDGDNIPVLVVGTAFLRLSNTDRIRVLKFVDYIFEITKEENGMYFIYSENDRHNPVGVFNKSGFQQY